ncbi:polysaccharide deacetylase family protein [Occultella gossypii]|uniref:Polysaccharide deacetylase family protein n=1 Tax=Occultella gossypii TaxID=2800820 RepID=A0ABS7SEH4_9MICO|nr:polysaccharide deacetylase family protein [Occultella gossypii]MBZ2198298.1 polysaccharide deacetylase family protein [Occultella gossypii]
MTQPQLLMTFDDCTVDHWFAHRGVFDDASARVTFFVSHVDRLTDDETDKLQALQRDGHTIASHGLRHLDGPHYVAQHGLAAYLEHEIEPSTAALAERGLGHRDFAYPYGRHDRATDDALTARFSWVRTTSVRHLDGRATQVLVDLDGRTRVLPSRGIDVGRRGVANLDDRATLLAVLDESARTGAGVCLYAHDIADSHQGLAEGRNFITPDRLREVLTAAQERGLAAEGFEGLPD